MQKIIGRGIHTEGNTHGGEIHTEENTKEKYTRGGHTYRGTHTLTGIHTGKTHKRRDAHTEDTHAGRHTRGGDIHMEGAYNRVKEVTGQFWLYAQKYQTYSTVYHSTHITDDGLKFII